MTARQGGTLESFVPSLADTASVLQPKATESRVRMGQNRVAGSVGDTPTLPFWRGWKNSGGRHLLKEFSGKGKRKGAVAREKEAKWFFCVKLVSKT